MLSSLKDIKGTDNVTKEYIFFSIRDLIGQAALTWAKLPRKLEMFSATVSTTQLMGISTENKQAESRSQVLGTLYYCYLTYGQQLGNASPVRWTVFVQSF